MAYILSENGLVDMRTMICAAVACVLILKGFAANYDDFLRQGYRWVAVDGPFACGSVDDLRKIPRNGGGDELKLKFVEELKAYFLVRGTVVQVIQEDKSAGVSQIRIDGITTPLWTWSDNLSRRPIKDIIGRIETQKTGTVSGTPEGSVVPGASASPSGSPAPSATP